MSADDAMNRALRAAAGRPQGDDVLAAHQAEQAARAQHGNESAEHVVAAYRTDLALEAAGATREEFEAALPPPDFGGGPRETPPQEPDMNVHLREALERSRGA